MRWRVGKLLIDAIKSSKDYKLKVYEHGWDSPKVATINWVEKNGWFSCEYYHSDKNDPIFKSQVINMYCKDQWIDKHMQLAIEWEENHVHEVEWENEWAQS